MKKLFLFVSMIVFAMTCLSQNTSPLVVKNFVNKPNEIIDKEQIPKDARKDTDGNRIARIRVSALGFDENIMREFVFVPDGFEITHTAFKNGQWLLHVSSKKNGELKIKYMGDCVFRLPFQLEADKVYELTLSIETATLIIRATPDDAEIYIDNDFAGTGYASKAVSVGVEHHYKVSCQDYFTKEGTTRFSERDEMELDVELDPDFGWITVTTTPKGASVYVDGVGVGKTPYVFEKIKKGQHVVEIKKDRYSTVVRTIEIKNAEINNELENIVLSDDETYAMVVLNSTPAGADIMMNDKYKGKTPTTAIVAPGLYKVSMTLRGYDNYEQKLTLTGNDTISINAHFYKSHEVSISTNGKDDMIIIDGIYVGKSPLTLTLVEGEHNVAATRDSVSFVNKTFNLTTDGEKSITIRVPEGALDGVFSIALGKKVRFSKGNLQYQASTKTLRFAKNQWGFLGDKNYNISQNNNGWIDLFNWATGKNPAHYWNDDSHYEGFNDWGKNDISNGYGYKWRTLSKDEWTYLLYERYTYSGMRFAKAQVDGVNGMVLVPDNWNAAIYVLKNTDVGNANYTDNIISADDWHNGFEANGAVFLPAAGYRYNGTDLANVNEKGRYWSSTMSKKNYEAYHLYFSNKKMSENLRHTEYPAEQSYGFSVRLVCDVK